MIGVVGHMSGGKSYYAVESMLKLMLSGHAVASNIKLNCQAVTSYLKIPCTDWKRLYYYLTDDEKDTLYHHVNVFSYGDYPKGSPRGSDDYDKRMVYIFLDEASSIFDSMSHSSEGHIKQVAVWARHTKKMGIELVLLMQFASELHKRLRNHVQEYISCTNTNNIRVPLLGFHLPWFLRNMSIRQRYLQDMETPIGAREWTVLRPEIYKCYNTAQIVVGGMDATPSASFDCNLAPRHFYQQFTRFLFLFVLSIVVLIGVLVYGLGKTCSGLGAG